MTSEIEILNKSLIVRKDTIEAQKAQIEKLIAEVTK
jgi:hypothetical protein